MMHKYFETKHTMPQSNTRARPRPTPNQRHEPFFSAFDPRRLATTPSREASIRINEAQALHDGSSHIKGIDYKVPLSEAQISHFPFLPPQLLLKAHLSPSRHLLLPSSPPPSPTIQSRPTPERQTSSTDSTNESWLTRTLRNPSHPPAATATEKSPPSPRRP